MGVSRYAHRSPRARTAADGSSPSTSQSTAELALVGFIAVLPFVP